MASGNFILLRNVPITKKAVRMAKENMHGLSDDSKMGQVSSWSLIAKSKDCTENITVADLVEVIAPDTEQCFP